MLSSTSLVDHVDCLIGQFAVVDITGRQFHGGFDRIVGVADLVVIFEVGLQTLQDFHRVLDRWLVHVDFLETTSKCAVFFEMLAELFVGGRPHAAQLTALQCRFQQVGRIHRTARGRTRTDHSVDFVDEQNGIVVVFEFGHNRLETLFEITTITGSSEKGAHVEAEDRRFRQHLGHFAVYDLAGKAFGDSGFTNARITNEKRVVFTAAAKHLNAAFNLVIATDQRINVPLRGFRVQVHAVFGKSGVFRFGCFGCCLRCTVFFVVSAHDWTRLAKGGVFGNTVRDKVDRVIAGHFLILEEIGRIGFAFRKDRDEDVRTRDFCATRRLDVDRGALDHTLEGSGGHGFGPVDFGDQSRQIVVDIFFEVFAQLIEIDRARFHDACGVGFIDQGQQKMFECSEFVATRIGQSQRRMDGLL